MNKAKLFSALNAFASARVGLIQAVIDAGYPTVESARPVIMEWVSIKTGCPLKVQGTERVVFDSKSAFTANARRTLADIMLNLAGTTRRQSVVANNVSKHVEVVLTKAQKAAIAALLAAFGGDKKAAKAAF